MKYFQCDYVEGCHPKILQKLIESNLEQTPGYGTDRYSETARKKIQIACGNPEAQVHFLVGGTQTNLTVIASILRPWQGVLSAETGHINCHETGAIEAAGHKVLALPSTDGTITGEQVHKYCQEHFESGIKEHTIQPGMVYISHPTENGTLYTKAQLTELKKACDTYHLPLFIDGARLGYGLTSPDSGLTLKDIAQLSDIFYIGGTKCGAMFGEAVVIPNPGLVKDFRYMIKQRGGMLAKGRLLGIQFDTLFTDGLYFEICEKAVKQALTIREAFAKKGIPLYGKSCTNQQFVVLNGEQLDKLGKKYAYEVWGPNGDGNTIVRFCTSWATQDEDVESLIGDIQEL
jgi:threonine aldolase